MGAPLVSVLTATIPGRERLFWECLASIKAQTFGSFEHRALLDDHGDGFSKTFNRLAEQAVSEWLFILCDDDLMLPRCIEAHVAATEHDTDIVYAPPLVWGEDAAQFCGTPPNIPSTCLIRKSLFYDLKGYDESLTQREDFDLFERARGRRAKFVRVEDTPTWIYRLHPGSKSRNNGVAS